MLACWLIYGYFNVFTNNVNKKTTKKALFLATEVTEVTEKKVYQVYQVNRKWISGEQDNRGHSVQRIEMLDAGFLSGLEIRDWLLRFTGEENAN